MSDDITDDDVRRAICDFNDWEYAMMAPTLSDRHVRCDMIAVGLRRVLTNVAASRQVTELLARLAERNRELHESDEERRHLSIEVSALRAAVEWFCHENPIPTGAKAERDDYATMVSCRSLFRLHALTGACRVCPMCAGEGCNGCNWTGKADPDGAA